MNLRKVKSLGFTLIELLLVVAIIGLLSSIISVALNTSRTKTRDARRVSDMKQIKSALDLYYTTGSGFPETDTWNASVGLQLNCSGTNIMRIPQDLLSPHEYVYTGSGAQSSGCGATVRSDYDIEFYIENKAKYYIMDEEGLVREKDTGILVGFDGLL